MAERAGKVFHEILGLKPEQINQKLAEVGGMPSVGLCLQLIAQNTSSTRPINDAAIISGSSNGPEARTAIATPSVFLPPKITGSKSMASRVTSVATPEVSRQTR
ncbi:MAG: hypothetical protein M0T78_00365 [Actinomycetota bacterium]|nr:hypothetical protein [Actinomycetota bacterium]